jgi:thiosulfate/3-mercaptopyruvate sulfurtransferase
MFLSLFKPFNRRSKTMEKAFITPADLKTLMASEPVVIIDTRDPASYAAGHIPGAVNVHDIFTFLATSTPEGMKELTGKFAAAFGAAGLSGKETAVVYEQSMNTGFGQSCRGYYLLKYLGYPKVAVLHGGLSAWLADGNATTTEVPAVTPATFPIDPSGASVMVDKDLVLNVVKRGGAVLLDVRDADEWIGESSSPYGMMKPSAAGPMMKSPEELKAEIASVGITPETPVILYCFKGARASNTFLALKEAGVKDVRMYFGSWNEWSRDPSLPIESGLPYKM